MGKGSTLNKIKLFRGKDFFKDSKTYTLNCFSYIREN